MKTIGLFEAKAKLSDICDQVASNGEPVVVTRRGTPLVRIEPVKEARMTIRERRDAYMARFGKKEKRDGRDFVAAKRSDEMPPDISLD